jgi:hypothetical protein
MVPDGDRAVEAADEPVQPVVGADAEGHGGHVVDHALDGRQPFRGEAHLVALGRGVVEPERAGEHRPDVVGVAGARLHGQDRGHRAAAEVGEVLGELVEVHVPARAEGVVLGLPVVAEDAALHQPQHAGAVVAALDQPLEGHPLRVRVPATVGEPAPRLPGGDHALLGLPADGHRGPAPLAGLDLVTAHEPAVDPGTGGDRLPDLLGGGVEGDLLAQLELVGHG